MNKGLLTGILAALTWDFLLPLNAKAARAEALSAVPGAVSPQQQLGMFELFASVPGSSGAIYHTWRLASQVGWQQSWQRYLPAPDDSLPP